MIGWVVGCSFLLGMFTMLTIMAWSETGTRPCGLCDACREARKHHPCKRWQR